MKRKLLILAFLTVCITSCSQETNFKEFVSYFPKKECPYSFENSDWKDIPSRFALKYLCHNDSSLLTWENIGIDQETSEIVYKKLEKYKYKGYAKIKVKKFLLLVYNEYNKDGLNEFTSIYYVGVYSKEGNLIDKMPFYIYDETGKYIPQIGSLTDKCQILIKKKEYIKNLKGIYTKSYKESTITYDIEDSTGKFTKVSEVVQIIDKSMK